MAENETADEMRERLLKAGGVVVAEGVMEVSIDSLGPFDFHLTSLGDGERHEGLVGSDPALDPDALACGAYGGAACDRLATVAPAGTENDLVAITCGGRRYTPGPQPCPTG